MDINFKKLPQSYWMASTPQAEYPTLNQDIKVDVAIVGGGIAGILTSYLLNQRGVKVAILEADHILQGTTGHTTAKITSLHGLKYSKIKSKMSEEMAKQYADANESAIRMFEKIAHENQIECDYVPESAYVYTLQDEYVDKIRDEADAAASLGIQATYLEEIPLGFPIKAAVRFDNQARFHPRKFLLPLAKKLTEGGGQIFEQSRIVEIEKDEKYILSTKDKKKITAQKVIIASHYPFLNKPGFYFTRIYPERSYVVAIKAKDKYPGGMYINAEEPTHSLRSQESSNGELILVGGENHKTGQSKDTEKHYQALADFANKKFAVEDIPYRWSTQDCMTMDEVPLVGQFTSETPNMYVATGYGKWGMTNSMASAMILKNLIIDGSSPWQDVYSPLRKTIMASAKNFVVENLNVAKELIEGKISPPSSSTVNTTCTHMGCEVSWNTAERSWDCPCHGSRFSEKGDVIEGPAAEPLSSHKDVKTIEKLVIEKF